MTDTALKERRPREYRKSGLFTLRRQLIDLGSRAIDGRSSVGVALRRSKAELIQDLGRKDSISTQQETLIELAARSKIMLDSVDSWILAQPTLINSRKKTMLSVVQQRQTIADGLTRIMKDLGLERRAKEVTLNDYIERQYGEKKCTPIKPLKKALQAFRSRKRTEMLDPSILGRVHAVEMPFSAGSEIPCGNRLCSVTFKAGGVANSPKRFCGDPCKQQASILRRAAALLIDRGKDQAWSVLEKIR